MLPVRTEISPTDDVVDCTRKFVPHGAALSVTCLPHRGLERTLQLSLRLSDEGYRVMPHVAARSIESKSQLEHFIRCCQRSGITEALVIAGDGPGGAFYDSALPVMREIAQVTSGEMEIAIAGYPEGHPQIGRLELLEAMREKQELASRVVTQLCFSAATINNYIDSIRDAGVSLPIHVGVAARVPKDRLLPLAHKIGVGPSTTILSRFGPLARRDLRGGNYSAEGLLSELPPAKIAGIHLHSFNNFAHLSWTNLLKAKELAG